MRFRCSSPYSQSVAQRGRAVRGFWIRSASWNRCWKSRGCLRSRSWPRSGHFGSRSCSWGWSMDCGKQCSRSWHHRSCSRGKLRCHIQNSSDYLCETGLPEEVNGVGQNLQRDTQCCWGHNCAKIRLLLRRVEGNKHTHKSEDVLANNHFKHTQLQNSQVTEFLNVAMWAKRAQKHTAAFVYLFQVWGRGNLSCGMHSTPNIRRKSSLNVASNGNNPKSSIASAETLSLIVRYFYSWAHTLFLNFWDTSPQKNSTLGEFFATWSSFLFFDRPGIETLCLQLMCPTIWCVNAPKKELILNLTALWILNMAKHSFDFRSYQKQTHKTLTTCKK